ncbi:hypothetical protein [Piscinibacter sp. HJYY11]|uniref:hypothetical protein n=1 Tax=Piscinibacter sp. HJYY11 TaxID=2801333 RepID=UPI00191F1943|nr:hypothetical protein [Piscinibacter sp. HJYY11]MBL0726504.1 hypothetical protein [Piscinibacter sp. HJYY11]
MTPPTSRHPATQRPPARTSTGAPPEDMFHAPPIAEDEDGPDVSAQPGAEVGHYGMGYGDPTRHQGGTWPGEGLSLPPTPQPTAPPTGKQMEPSMPPGGGTATAREKGGGQQ